MRLYKRRMKWVKLFSFVIIIMILTSCSDNKPVNNIVREKSTIEQQESSEKNKMIDVNIVIENQTFHAKLYSNDSTKALIKKLPITMTMNELNGNEKYSYLSEELPSSNDYTGNINTGDIMLFNNDCLVIFYKDFSTTYHYTKLGRISDIDNLEKTLSVENVEVTFEIE